MPVNVSMQFGRLEELRVPCWVVVMVMMSGGRWEVDVDVDVDDGNIFGGSALSDRGVAGSRSPNLTSPLNFTPKQPPSHISHNSNASSMDNIDHLRREIALRESELADLKSQLALAESSKRAEDTSTPWKWPLSQEEYDRYGRQMIVPKFGLYSMFLIHFWRG